MLYYFPGGQLKNFPKRSICYIISCMKKWWEEGNRPWILASESSVIQATVTSGKAQCQGRKMGDSCHPLVRTDEEWAGQILETMSIWRKPHLTITFLSLNSSVFFFQTQSISGSHLKLPEARKSQVFAGSYQLSNQELTLGSQWWKAWVLTTGRPGHSPSVLSSCVSLYSLVLTSQKRSLRCYVSKGEAIVPLLCGRSGLSSAIVQNNANRAAV